MRRILLALALATALSHAACGADNTTTDSMKIRLQVEDRVITATLIDSKTTQDFISLLPLTLTMNDLFRREKYGHLARAISTEGNGRTHTKSETSPTGLQALTLPSSTATMARRFPTPVSSSSAKWIPAWKLLMCPGL
jgi:hypothetical protein